MSIFDIPEDTANQIYNVSNLVLIIAGVLVAAATITSIWAGGILSRAMDRKLSDNIVVTAKANEGQAKANAEAAKANERATQLELGAAKFQKEAAEAKLELAKLQEKMAWRIVSPEQERSFIDFLATAPKGNISMTYLTNDPETANFAIRLAELFNKAGFYAPKSLNEMKAMLPIGGVMIGVTISVKDEKDIAAGALQRALGHISIEAKGRVRPNQAGEIEVEVGQKLR